MGKDKVRHADLLLRCSSLDHKDCYHLRDAMMNFKNVTMTYITRTIMDTDYCVAGSAIVYDGKINKFKRELRSLEGDGFKTSKMKMFITKRKN